MCECYVQFLIIINGYTQKTRKLLKKPIKLNGCRPKQRQSLLYDGCEPMFKNEVSVYVRQVAPADNLVVPLTEADERLLGLSELEMIM